MTRSAKQTHKLPSPKRWSRMTARRARGVTATTYVKEKMLNACCPHAVQNVRQNKSLDDSGIAPPLHTLDKKLFADVPKLHDPKCPSGVGRTTSPTSHKPAPVEIKACTGVKRYATRNAAAEWSDDGSDVAPPLHPLKGKYCTR